MLPPLSGTEFELEVDLALTVMGFTGSERTLIDQLQLEGRF